MPNRFVAVAVAVALAASGCAPERIDPSVAAICDQAASAADPDSGLLVIVHPAGRDPSPSLDAARAECPEALEVFREIEYVTGATVTNIAAACRAVSSLQDRQSPTAFEISRAGEAVATLSSVQPILAALALKDCLPYMAGLAPEMVLDGARRGLLCNLVAAAQDASRSAASRMASIEQFDELTGAFSQDEALSVLEECGSVDSDRKSFIASMLQAIDQQAADEQAERAKTDEERAEAAREARERENAERLAQIDPALMRCYEDYAAARYLSSQALRASTCIVDKLFFGGLRPTEANTSQLIAEMLFHATWATWDSATRRTYCNDVKRRGFDAAETIGMALSRTWQSQIRAAGSSWYLDDYDLVLDVLDTCEEY